MLIVFVCSFNVIPLSNVTPSMVDVSVTGVGVLKSVMCGWTMCSRLNGVSVMSEPEF